MWAKLIYLKKVTKEKKVKIKSIAKWRWKWWAWCAVVSSETNTQRSELGGKMNKKKEIYFFVYIKFDVGIETGKDKENNLIEVISQGINFIILDKISPLYNVIYKGSSVVMLLLWKFFILAMFRVFSGCC